MRYVGQYWRVRDFLLCDYADVRMNSTSRYLPIVSIYILVYLVKVETFVYVNFLRFGRTFDWTLALRPAASNTHYLSE